MAYRAKNLLEKFLRSYTNQFSAREMHKVCASLGFDFSMAEVESFLSANPYIFSLTKKSYITRAGVFTGELFSIKPTAQEVDQGLVVIGDRCIPFTDTEMLPHELSFCCDRVKLKLKTGIFDAESARKFYCLYGDEYLSQYIAMDPVNSDLNLLESDYALPSRVKLTGFDLEPLIKKYGFVKGDRILCCVSDWDKGKINVAVSREHDEGFSGSKSSEMRHRWYDTLETALMENFKRHGPCSSIEEQLSILFLENRHQLCSLFCGSIEEYLHRYAKKVSLEPFGVETRIWKKGEEAPAVGEWNKTDLERDIFDEEMSDTQRRFFSIPPFVFDQFILNMFYKREGSLRDIVELLFPEDSCFSEEEKSELLLLLEQRHDILKKGYNWFADRGTGKVRQRALELFSRVSYMVFQVDKSSCLDDFPQQELVILSQLYGHLLKMLQELADESVPDEETEGFLLSLEGMEWNFEDIRSELKDAVNRNNLNRFKVIKGRT